jgi:CheY-like chemotaxis protein
MRLRSHLVALVLAALVPVLGFAALVIRENTRLQLVATERGMRETAHAVARTVDKELETAVHLVALTGYGQPDDRRQALDAGFDAHLVKPVHPDALLAVIEAAGAVS